MFDDTERTGDSPPDFGNKSPRAFSSQPDAYRLPRCLCLEPARSEEQTVSNNRAETHPTIIEDPKNSIQLQPPTHNLSLEVARGKVFDEFVLPGQCFDFLLYFLNTPVVKSVVSGRSRSIHHRIDSIFQSVYRIAYRLAEFVCRLSARSPPERITDVGAQYPKVHAILFVDHLVLAMFEPGRLVHGRG